MTAVPGLLVVWSATTPKHDVHRIGPEGFTLGRDHADPGDDRISRNHLKVRVEQRWARVKDLGSRNGTNVDGASLAKDDAVLKWLPVVVRAGRTVGVVVPDVRRYEELVIAREAGVPGSVMEALRREVDEIARAEENLTLEAPRDFGLELARRYAQTIGGETLEFDPRRGVSLERFLTEGRPRTVILVLVGHALELGDLPTIQMWLETDVRFVTVMTHNTKPVSMLDAGAIARLRSHVIEVWPRYDEVPARIVEVVRSVAPNTQVHASVIESVLLGLSTRDEAWLLEALRTAVLEWVTPGRADEVAAVMGQPEIDRSLLRGGDVNHALYPVNAAVCIVGKPRP